TTGGDQLPEVVVAEPELHHRRLVAEGLHEVGALAGVDLVATGSAVDEVVARSGLAGVVAGHAREPVGIDEIGSATGADRVVARTAVDPVAEPRAGDDVVVARPGHAVSGPEDDRVGPFAGRPPGARRRGA